MTNKRIVLICAMISIFTSLSTDENIFLINSKDLIQTLLVLFGFCFSGATSIISSLKKNIDINSNIKIHKSYKKAVDSIEKDVLLIMYSIIALIIANFIKYINIPIINDFNNIQFGLIQIISIKNYGLNFVFSMGLLLSACSFYDLIKTSFIVLKNTNKSS